MGFFILFIGSSSSKRFRRNLIAYAGVMVMAGMPGFHLTIEPCWFKWWPVITTRDEPSQNAMLNYFTDLCVTMPQWVNYKYSAAPL